MALENILQHILKKKDKEALDIFLTTINKEWKINHGDQRIVVWLGLDHRGKRKGNEIFVCFHSADIVSKFSKFLCLPIIYRRLDETEMEPLENRLNEKYQKVSLKKEDAANIKSLINEVGDDLFKSHRNLEAISVSSVKSRKKGILQQTSIVLYCRLKYIVPFGEGFFPKELKINDQIYPTDVREGFFSLGMIPGQHQSITLPQVLNHTLRMGCSIGPSTAHIAGTLGPFVRDKDNNMGFLTCAHVLGLNTPVGTAVCQPALSDPGPADDTRICGTVCKSKFDFSSKPGVDAALVLIDQSNREVDPASFIWIDRQQLREAGFAEDDAPSYEDGEVIAHADFDQVDDKRVIKIGRSSGLTRGTFALDGAMLKIYDADLKLHECVPCSPELYGRYFLMKSQFIIHTVGNNSFFSLGDSGSGVYLVERRGVENKLVLIGIAIGALSPSECVVTPIGSVLKALDLDESCIIKECVMQH
ncbi:hypothetical protein CHS0354_037021 [Potamilus streckersoni]|uniref:Uncharacterized protein n=1 Tax=Potamilus streckersoni TaxID=2493646 RepID=A0AAE0SLB0_9BIVA|nr:hypothetical protein CHS0354_037021 [Potamilus streckersoni]